MSNMSWPSFVMLCVLVLLLGRTESIREMLVLATLALLWGVGAQNRYEIHHTEAPRRKTSQ